MRKINVFIIDDSAVVRQVLTQILSKDPEINVVGSAIDPIFAWEKMNALPQWPDVVTLDIEMPRQNGLSFLEELMEKRPTPVVMCSTLTEAGSDAAVRALFLGAVSVIAKPKSNVMQSMGDASNNIITAVKDASYVNIKKINAAPLLKRSFPEQLVKNAKPEIVQQMAIPRPGRLMDRIVAIGTSTGGTQALEYVLTALDEYCPGIVIVQHMPENFTLMFAERLNSICTIGVKEARSGDQVKPGLALIAPGGKHMQIRSNGGNCYVDVIDGPLVNRHRPSVDVLFRSVAKIAGRNATGIIMTGMGNDGASGLLEMKRAGACTIAQDEASCVVFGMPKEAIHLGAVDHVMPLSAIPAAILGAPKIAHKI